MPDVPVPGGDPFSLGCVEAGPENENQTGAPVTRLRPLRVIGPWYRGLITHSSCAGHPWATALSFSGETVAKSIRPTAYTGPTPMPSANIELNLLGAAAVLGTALGPAQKLGVGAKLVGVASSPTLNGVGVGSAGGPPGGEVEHATRTPERTRPASKLGAPRMATVPPASLCSPGGAWTGRGQLRSRSRRESFRTVAHPGPP